MIKNNSLTVVSGPAGTSKTFSTCYTALELLANKKIEQIILTKPLLESSFSMGFLPGSVEEKIEPYMKSYISTFKKLIGVEKFQELMINDVIKIETLNFMRGETYDNSILLLDEGQNLEMKDLMLWITRLGKDSKAVLMGDMSQYDVKENKSDFGKFRDILDGMKDFSIFEFGREDIVRNPFLIELTDRYEKWKYNIV
jgi:phosphate starvation-inducible PhoH-like protein